MGGGELSELERIQLILDEKYHCAKNDRLYRLEVSPVRPEALRKMFYN